MNLRKEFHKQANFRGAQASAAVPGREWLPGEDELLARGLLRFGQEPGRLRQYFLPGRAAEEIPPRIRNRCTLRAGDNPVKVCHSKKLWCLGPKYMPEEVSCCLILLKLPCLTSVPQGSQRLLILVASMPRLSKWWLCFRIL